MTGKANNIKAICQKVSLSVFMILGSVFANAVLAQETPAYRASRPYQAKLEGEKEFFGEWEIEVERLTHTTTEIKPEYTTVTVCLKEGATQKDVPVMAIPRKGRCIMSTSYFSKHSISINVTCDEGETPADFGFHLSPGEDGLFTGEISYGMRMDSDSGQSFNVQSLLKAKRIRDCGDPL